MKIKTINIILFLILIFIILSQLYNLRENVENSTPCEDVKKNNKELSAKIQELDEQLDVQKQEQTQIQEQLQKQINSQKTTIDGQTQDLQNNVCKNALTKLQDFKQQMQQTINNMKNILP